MTNASTSGTPTLNPPAEHSDQGGAGGTSAPTLSGQEAAALAAELTATPSLTPPMATAGALAAGATATWRNNVRIDALWSIDETRNAFVNVTGLGWRKIYNGRDGSFQALLTLASQARQTNRPVNVREEADGMIYEIYLW